MKRVFAIASVAMRSAVRLRFVAAMIIVLLLGILGLPLTVEGDGTPEGQVIILLRYTLAFTGVVLSIATLWAGCAAVSTDIQHRHIQLIVSKPVHRAQVWLGKWIGIMGMSAVLLLFSGVVIHGLLLWTLRSDQMTRADREVLYEEILVARRALTPDYGKEEEEIKAILMNRRALNDPDLTPHADDLYKAARHRVLTRRNTVSPGQTLSWNYPLKRPLPHGHSLLIRYRVSSSRIGTGEAPGTWYVTAEGKKDSFQHASLNLSSRFYAFRVPAELVEDSTSLTIEYQNTSDQDVTAVIPYQNGLSVLVFEGGFPLNYLRAFMLLFIQLALFAAVGLTAGTLFTMPVAALVSLYLLILVQTTSVIHRTASASSILGGGHSHGAYSSASGGQAGHWMEPMLHGMYRLLDLALQPLRTPGAIELLSSGQLIPWNMVIAALFVKVALYAGLLFALAAWVFRRKEVALPAIS